jgi:ABC-2 type transport system permease protein
MQAMIALIKREYLEHRGAFILGPTILLGLMLLAALYMTWSASVDSDMGGDLPSALRFYEAAFAILVAGWWLYLLIMLFFYFADAFSSDSRNNSMLFWKSMPQTDLKIFGTKMAAAFTVFPAAILLAVAISGIIAYLPALTAGNMLPGYVPPGVGEAASAYLNILAIAVVFFALGLLWYAPFFAWVGLLSVLFRRWAIPLAFLIPATLGLFENLITRGGNRRGGVVFNFFKDRLNLHYEGLDFETIWILGEPWHAPELIMRMLGGMDWPSLAGGLAVATILVYLASEYRRRYVLT